MLVEAPTPREESGEASLAARAAWLYFSGGMTQGEIARRLGIAGTKAHRLIARASREGLVRIFVDASVSECLALEDALCAAFKLDFCRVAPDLDEGPLPLKALGQAGAAYLKNLLERGEHALIGIGHGRTLAAAIHQLPSVPANGTRFVSVLGGFTRRFAANPYDVIHRLAERTGAEAFQIPLPTFANTAEDKAVLLAQPGVGEVFDLARSAPLVIAGIGDMSDEGFLVSNRMMGVDELAELRRDGAVGELLGHFFGADGRAVAPGFSARALAPDLAALAGAQVVALVGGDRKVEATAAVLRSGILNGLVTDERTACALAALG